jgi:hypothetical protein
MPANLGATFVHSRFVVGVRVPFSVVHGPDITTTIWSCSEPGRLAFPFLSRLAGSNWICAPTSDAVGFGPMSSEAMAACLLQGGLSVRIEARRQRHDGRDAADVVNMNVRMKPWAVTRPLGGPGRTPIERTYRMA